MDLSIGVIRMVLFVSNGIFACTGVAILAMSALIYKEMHVYSEAGNFIESKYAGILITLMVVGSMVILVTLLGLYGTVRENQKVLMAFAVMLFVIYVFEIVLSTLAFLRSNDIDVRVKTAMTESFGTYRFDPKIANSFNVMQRNLQCCGVKGPTDYWAMYTGIVPRSCCPRSDGEMCLQSIYNYNVYQTGCFEAVRDFVARSGVILGSVTLSLAFSEVLAIVFALLLIIQLYREEKKMGIHLKPGYKFEAVEMEPQDNENLKTSKPHQEGSETLKFQPQDLEALDFQLQDIEVVNRPPQEVDELTFQQEEIKPVREVKEAPTVAALKSSPKAVKVLKPSPESIKALKSSTSITKSSPQVIPVPQKSPINVEESSSSAHKLEDPTNDSPGSASGMTEV